MKTWVALLLIVLLSTFMVSYMKMSYKLGYYKEKLIQQGHNADVAYVENMGFIDMLMADPEKDN